MVVKARHLLRSKSWSFLGYLGYSWLRPHNKILGCRHGGLHPYTSASRLSGKMSPNLTLSQTTGNTGFYSINIFVGKFFGSSAWWQHVGCWRLSAHKVKHWEILDKNFATVLMRYPIWCVIFTFSPLDYYFYIPLDQDHYLMRNEDC